MFHNKVNNVPTFHLKWFTCSWEQRRLGDICQITMGQSPDGSTYSTSPIGYILVQGNADLKEGWVCPRVWTTQKTKLAYKGDLIFSVRAPVGAVGKTLFNAVIGRGVAAIKGNEFIYQTLVRLNENKYWDSISVGSTFDSINSSTLNNIHFCVPKSGEQEQIGKFFSNLDSLITLHQRYKYEGD